MKIELLRFRFQNVKSKLKFRCLLGFVLLSSGFISAYAQSKVDIEITFQFSRDTARGGEEVPFTATVRNIGQAKATDVILVTGQYGTLNIISGESDLGKCVIGKESNQDKFRCEFGDISPGASANIRGVVKLMDWDMPDPNEILNFPSFQADPNAPAPPVDERTTLGRFSVAPAEPDDNRDNNDVELRLKLMPSANRAPRIKLISPKNDATLIRPSGRPMSYAVTIEASDLDGKVVAVRVIEPRHNARPVGMNEKGYIFEYEGVQYPAIELDQYLRKNPPPERLATPSGKNTYMYTMTDPPYGHNQLLVTAVDNGGREATSWIWFEVKGDSTIEVVSPKSNQIVSPGSTLTVETVSRLKQGRLSDVVITGDGIGYSEGLVKMVLVSKQGNIYRHRFEIRDVPENSVYSHVRVRLLEDTGGYADADVGYLVRNVPKMSFTSFRIGDTLQKSEMEQPGSEMINISYDIENRSWDDKYELFIDGKNYNTLRSDSINWLNPTAGKHTLQIVASFANIEIARSPVITVYVK